jgi:hypothetical protein
MRRGSECPVKIRSAVRVGRDACNVPNCVLSVARRGAMVSLETSDRVAGIAGVPSGALGVVPEYVYA